jgi:hypothetical protein
MESSNYAIFQSSEPNWKDCPQSIWTLLQIKEILSSMNYN